MSAQKKEWLARKAAEKKKIEEEQRTKFQEEAMQIPPDLVAKIEAAKSEQQVTAEAPTVSQEPIITT